MRTDGLHVKKQKALRERLSARRRAEYELSIDTRGSNSGRARSRRPTPDIETEESRVSQARWWG